MLDPIDLHFLNTPETIGCFLLEEEDGYALFETGPHSTYDRLLATLTTRGVRLKDIKKVFLTHIHLDHAGSAWALADAGAKVYVHPKGQPHLLDPSRLLASAKRIYQDDMDRLWGDFRPIPAHQLIVPEDREVIPFGKSEIIAHYTPGHASHHIAWQIGNELVAGDVAGVRIHDGPVMPPCPPPDIDIEAWNQSIDRLLELDLNGIWLTHFGLVVEIEPHLQALRQRLQSWADWIYPWFEKETPAHEIVPAFQQYVQEDLLKHGVAEDELDKYEKANPSWMSVAGLLRYWKKKSA